VVVALLLLLLLLAELGLDCLCVGGEIFVLSLVGEVCLWIDRDVLGFRVEYGVRGGAGAKFCEKRGT